MMSLSLLAGTLNVTIINDLRARKMQYGIIEKGNHYTWPSGIAT